MKKLLRCVFCAVGMFLLIIDSKTALLGAQEGIDLCVHAVIPALLPFLILSSLLCRDVLGVSFSILRPVGKLCNIPKGSESLLILGFLGGYPVGAKNIVQAQKYGALQDKYGRRMLGFCNNAGPAFIFGMVGGMFSRMYLAWILWLIHIISALLVGMILPRLPNTACRLPNQKDNNSVTDIENSIYTMAKICLWVILFRVIIAFLKRWVFWNYPLEIQTFLTGLLELSNGIFSLQTIACEGMRFIICSAMLSFGGICVAMQTLSVTEMLGTGYYFPGKVMQGCFSILLSYIVQFALFNGSDIVRLPVYFLCIPLICIIATVVFIYKVKNNSRKMELSLV